MTLEPAKLNATYQDVLDAPAHMRAELIDGKLYLQPRPRGSHQLAVLQTVLQLRTAQHRPGEKGGWVILPEVELHIPMTLVPDLSGWLSERFTEEVDSAYFSVVPDWVCEVLSPGTRAYDLGLKRRVYLERGVEWLWIIDPAEQVLEVFAANPEGRSWELAGTWDGDGTLPLVMPFGLPLSLAPFWSLR